MGDIGPFEGLLILLNGSHYAVLLGPSLIPPDILESFAGYDCTIGQLVVLYPFRVELRLKLALYV